VRKLELRFAIVFSIDYTANNSSYFDKRLYPYVIGCRAVFLSINLWKGESFTLFCNRLDL